MMRAVVRMFTSESQARDITLVLIAIFGAWEIGVALAKPSPLILPAPSQVFREFLATPVVFLKHLGFTLATTCAGFALAVILGVILAVGIASSSLLERSVYTLLVALNSIPKVALAPLFVI